MASRALMAAIPVPCVRSRSEMAFCRVLMAPLCLLAVKPKRWWLPRWALRVMSNVLMHCRANTRIVLCFITTCRHTRRGKPGGLVHQNGVRLDMGGLPSARCWRCFLLRRNSLIQCVSYRKSPNLTVQVQWHRYVVDVLH